MGIILNKKQEEACQAAIDWYYNSSNTLFQISAEAGCGKSVLVGEIVRRLGLRQEDILPMAYSGQATMVMRMHGLVNAKTCHSGLFDPIQVPVRRNGRILIDYRFNTPIMRWDYIPKDFTHTKIKLIILDEAWMIPKSMKQYIDATRIKVIATGDPGQLPPVEGEPAYLVDGIIFYLDELMRQSENSGLVYLARRVRRGLPFDFGLYGNVLVIPKDDLTNQMIAKSEIVLCGKNNTKIEINNKVRHEILRIYSDYPHYGERVICRKNNWKKEVNNEFPLVNGMTGTIISPPFISSMDRSTKTFKIDFAPDISPMTPFMDLDINYQFLNSNDSIEKEKLKNSEFTRGDLFEYAYASTTHLAQGSEYSRGIYIEESMRSSDLQRALTYTAITRFRDQLIIVKQKPKYWNGYNPFS
jgi:exodeoxyribonuclease V